MRVLSITLVALVACLGGTGSAEVAGHNDAGFAVAGTATISTTPRRVWVILVDPARWWDPQHSWSGKAANFSLRPQAGGCFCETLPGGGSVEHMRVIYADPARQLRMAGALGPLQGEGLAATLTVTLEASGDRTKLTWSYKAGGYTDLPLAQIATAVNGVLTEQFARLARVVEAGDSRAR
jgi:uncharacterized protein YndB with AHSA1/START domain